ncbi:MAG: hypothetical protein EAZ64_08065 [Sphingobacteriales bacterium]|nr:MAG: hypothetical protein EAZ64_08065 [Sphingobacteriales bacterium]
MFTRRYGNPIGWLNKQQFIEAAAVPIVTTGHYVLIIGFIGYLLAGFTGAFIVALAIILPFYIWLDGLKK